jgi:hypothetical protein
VNPRAAYKIAAAARIKNGSLIMITPFGAAWLGWLNEVL